MYGQPTQISALAMTGASILYWSVAAGVLFMAGLTLLTIVSVLKHKAKKKEKEEEDNESSWN